MIIVEYFFFFQNGTFFCSLRKEALYPQNLLELAEERSHCLWYKFDFSPTLEMKSFLGDLMKFWA